MLLWQIVLLLLCNVHIFWIYALTVSIHVHINYACTVNIGIAWNIDIGFLKQILKSAFSNGPCLASCFNGLQWNIYF